MRAHEILKQTLSALWETNLRSFLTMFRHRAGRASPRSFCSSDSASASTQTQKERLPPASALNIAILFGVEKPAHRPEDTPPAAILPALTIDDAIAIQQQANLVKTVSPELRRTRL